jgi:hypothetical protein
MLTMSKMLQLQLLELQEVLLLTHLLALLQELDHYGVHIMVAQMKQY